MSKKRRYKNNHRQHQPSRHFYPKNNSKKTSNIFHNFLQKSNHTLSKSDILFTLQKFIKMKKYEMNNLYIKNWELIEIMIKLTNWIYVNMNMNDNEEISMYSSCIINFMKRDNVKFKRGKFVNIFIKCVEIIEKKIIMVKKINNENGSSSWVIVDLLRMLMNLSKENYAFLDNKEMKRVNEMFLKLLDKENNDKQVDKEVKRYILMNISNITKNKWFINGGDYSKLIYDKIVLVFDNIFDNVFNQSLRYNKLMINVLHCFSSILIACKQVTGKKQQQKKKKIHLNESSKIFPSIKKLKKLLFYGTKIVPMNKINKINEKRIVKVVYSSESDTEYDKSEFGNRDTVEIRIQTLLLLGNMVKIDFKSMFSKWKMLIPSTDDFLFPPTLSSSKTVSIENLSKYTFATVLVFDHSSKCRSAAAKALGWILAKSKNFLPKADEREGSKSFVTYAQRLAQMIKKLHYTFIYALERESVLYTKSLICRCLGYLVISTPYDKVKQDLNKVLDMMKDIILENRSMENNYTISAMFCLERIFGKSNLEEVKSYLNIFVDGKNELIDLLCEIIVDSKRDINIRIQSANTINSLAKNYQSFMIKNWKYFFDLIEKCTKSKEQSIVIISIQIISNLMYKNVKNNVMIDSSMWEDLLENVLIKLQFNSSKIVIGLILQTCSSISPSSFVKLSKKYQKFIIDFVFKCLKSNILAVKSSAFKALTIFNTFKELVEDDLKYVNMNYDIFKRILKSDSPLPVKSKSTLAFANICDTIRFSKWMNIENKEKYILNFFIELLSACNLRDKIQFSSVRGIGYLISISSKSILNTKISIKNERYFLNNDENSTIMTIENECFSQLSKCVSGKNPKVKWNCCFSFGTMFENPNIQKDIKIDIINILCLQLKTNSNFKVCIQSSNSLLIGIALPFIKTKEEDHEVLTKNILESICFCHQNAQKTKTFQQFHYVSTLSINIFKIFMNIINNFYIYINDENQKNINEIIFQYPKTIFQIIKIAIIENKDVNKELQKICEIIVNLFINKYKNIKELEVYSDIVSLKMYYIDESSMFK